MMTLERADAIYGEAFRRAMEFVCYQRMEGDVLEFGTLNGFTARKLAEMMVELGHPGALWLFDSFQGMPAADGRDRYCPEVIAGAWKPGTPTSRHPEAMRLIRDELTPLLPDRLRIVPGWFENTACSAPPRPSIVHIDCDFYESTITVLKSLRPQQGTVFFFDDYNTGRANNKFGERAAIRSLPISLEPWFSYGWHGQAFIYHE